MIDIEHKKVDDKIEQLESRLLVEYNKAFKELESKQKKMMKDYLNKLDTMKAKYENKEISYDEFRSWLQGQAYNQKWVKDMTNTIANDMNKINNKAANIINGTLPGIYADNLNFGTYNIEKSAMINTSFTLYDKSTVLNLAKKDTKLLPMVKTKNSKDIRWNMQKLNSAITQSILQGESLEKAAKRLRNVVGMNYRSSKRSARTALTAAENAGRLDSYERAAKLGIKGKKRWMATLDNHTRDSHALLDGEAVEYDEKFSNYLEYPGDPTGEPSEVYNCRCTMVYDLWETDFSTMERDTRLGMMTYEDWKVSHGG